MAIYSEQLEEKKHILFFPVTPLPNTDTPTLIKGYLHLLYLTLFTPRNERYLLYKIYPLLDLYIKALNLKGFKGIGENIPDNQSNVWVYVQYAPVMKMIVSEHLEEDYIVNRLLDCLIPTLFKNVPPSVYPTRELPFLGFTLEGAINTYTPPERIVKLDTAKIVELDAKNVPPLVKWFYYFFAGLPSNEFNFFVRRDLRDVASPCIPRFDKGGWWCYTTIVNLLTQMVDLIDILDLNGRYYDSADYPKHPSNFFSLAPSKHELYKERLPIQYPAICRVMWGNFLYGGLPELRSEDKYSLRELFQHMVGKLGIKQKKKEDLTTAEQAINFALMMMDGYGLENLNPDSPLKYLDPLHTIRGYTPQVSIEAQVPISEDDEEEDEEDPATAPIQTSAADAKALQGGNNPSASVQDDSGDSAPEDGDVPDNPMGSTNTPGFAPGSNIDSDQSGPLAPFTGDPMNLTDASNDYYYKLSVAALNKKLNESGVTVITPYVKNTLGTWCQLGMWLYPASNTRTLVSKLGLEKYLAVFNRKNLRKQ